MDIFQKLIQYADLLYKFAYTKTDDANEAEDLVQETYLYTLIAIKKGTQIDNLKNYILKILNNKFNDSLRRKYSQNILTYNLNSAQS